MIGSPRAEFKNMKRINFKKERILIYIETRRVSPPTVGFLKELI